MLYSKSKKKNTIGFLTRRWSVDRGPSLIPSPITLNAAQYDIFDLELRVQGHPGNPKYVSNMNTLHHKVRGVSNPKIVSEYDQEIPQSQTADHPVAPRGRAVQPSRDTRKTN